MRCFIFDIDGTIANLDHRLHLIKKEHPDWNAFFDACDRDAPIPHMIELAQTLCRFNHIVYVSGRSDRSRDATLKWMRAHELPSGSLFMRTEGDHKPDHVLKLELLDQVKAYGYEPIMAFDDRKTVVDMWRKAGIPCAQVAEGDF